MWGCVFALMLVVSVGLAAVVAFELLRVLAAL
jgi:hypothetical protein